MWIKNYLQSALSEQTDVLSGQTQAVSLLQVLSHLLEAVVVDFEPLEQEPKANASVKVRIKLFISIFWFAGMENFEISTYPLTADCSSSELHPNIFC